MSRPEQDSRCIELGYPKGIPDICNFLGLPGYYRRFIKGFSKITKPVTELLGKDKKIEW
jgi:hypothetical protein